MPAKVSCLPAQVPRSVSARKTSRGLSRQIFSFRLAQVRLATTLFDLRLTRRVRRARGRLGLGLPAFAVHIFNGRMKRGTVRSWNNMVPSGRP